MQNGGSMLESKILPTILIILPSSVFLLLAHPGAGKAAAEKCNTRPSSSAPQGSHWHYRVNHTDNRRCWFLSSEEMKVRSNELRILDRRGVIELCEHVVAQVYCLGQVLETNRVLGQARDGQRSGKTNPGLAPGRRSSASMRCRPAAGSRPAGQRGRYG